MDEETGLYYYGARYYNPRISIFYGVDPLSEKYPDWSPYHYCHNNPVMLVDPDGMEATRYEDENGNELLTTKDGSNMIVTVWAEQADKFWEDQKAALDNDDLDYIDSQEWNFDQKSKLLGVSWDQGKENMMSHLATDYAQRNMALFIQTGDYSYFNEASWSHTGSYRDPISIAAAVTGTIYGLTLINRIPPKGQSKSQLKSIESLEKQINIHKRKIKSYQSDPYRFDNKGTLRNAPNNAIRQKMIQGRLKHLRKEIRTFRENIQKINNSQ